MESSLDVSRTHGALSANKNRHGGVHVQEPDELGLGDGSGVMSAFWFTPSDITEFHRGA